MEEKLISIIFKVAFRFAQKAYAASKKPVDVPLEVAKAAIKVGVAKPAPKNNKAMKPSKNKE